MKHEVCEYLRGKVDKIGNRRGRLILLSYKTKSKLHTSIEILRGVLLYFYEMK